MEKATTPRLGTMDR
ncbi:unnamed protein product, partial [Rotaria sordida]